MNPMRTEMRYPPKVPSKQVNEALQRSIRVLSQLHISEGGQDNKKSVLQSTSEKQEKELISKFDRCLTLDGTLKDGSCSSDQNSTTAEKMKQLHEAMLLRDQLMTRLEAPLKSNKALKVSGRRQQRYKEDRKNLDAATRCYELIDSLTRELNLPSDYAPMSLPTTVKGKGGGMCCPDLKLTPLLDELPQVTNDRQRMDQSTVPRKLQVGQKQIFSMQDGEEMAIICKAAGVATILKKENTRLPAYVLDKAAYAVSGTINRDTLTASIAFLNSNLESVEEASLKYTSDNTYIRPTVHYTLECRCRKPTLRSKKTEQMERCSGRCDKYFHAECKDSLMCNSDTFRCVPCRIQTTGVKWSDGGVINPDSPINTCCQDNLWNALVLEAERCPDLARRLHEGYFKNTCVPVKEVLEACQSNKYAQAQKIWYKYIVSQSEEIAYQGNGNDVYGSESDMLVKYLHNANKLYNHYHCTDVKCNGQTTLALDQFFVVKGEPVEDAVKPKMEPHCPKCTQRMTYTGLEGGEAPPYLLQLCTNAHMPEDIMANFPKTISIDQYKYNIKYILLHNAKRSHFTSLLWHENDWVHYDDMPATDRIRYPVKEDYDGCTVDNVTYFLDPNHLPA